MSKNKKKNSPLRSPPTPVSESTHGESVAQSQLQSQVQLPVTGWFGNRAVRWVVSVVLMGYMAVVLLGPLSNPVGSEFLTRPMAQFVSPIHRALFLGHGYRFFGPDPGPSHSIVYRITARDGDVTEHRFPDPGENWPRLMYHRWFMLSETVYQEHAQTPDEESFRETNEEMDRQIVALRSNGRSLLSQRVADEKQKLDRQYKNTRERIDALVTAIAKHLLQSKGGRRIEIFLQERSIPFPVSVLTGDKLTDEKFLSPLTKIGEYQNDSLDDSPGDSQGQSPDELIAPTITDRPTVTDHPTAGETGVAEEAEDLP